MQHDLGSVVEHLLIDPPDDVEEDDVWRRRVSKRTSSAVILLNFDPDLSTETFSVDEGQSGVPGRGARAH